MRAVMDRLGDHFTLLQLDQALAETMVRKAPEVRPPRRTHESILGLASELPSYNWNRAPGQRGGDLPAFQQRAARHRGSATGAFRGRGSRHLFRHVHGLRRPSHAAATHGHQRLPPHRHPHPQRRRAQNKGLALFPRRIGGHYVMCSRIDGENLYLMTSDIVHFWETAKILRVPQRPWEFVQIGNCGSPWRPRPVGSC